MDGLRLLKSYKQEESYIVWNNVAQQLAKISVIIADKEFYADWQRFKLDLFSVIKVKQRFNNFYQFKIQCNTCRVV